MYILLTMFAVLFVATIVEVYFNIPTVQAVRQGVSHLFAGRGYARFFFATGLFAAAFYAIGLLAIAPFVGLYDAGIEIGTACLLIFLLGMGRCILSGLGDFGRLALGAPSGSSSEFGILSSAVFFTAFWGTVILLTFYDHSRSGTLIGVEVHPERLLGH
ncbi:MAG TPA: hypothetical protein V6C97_25920 [Oculatellaceae cyanobacterium]